MVCDRLSGLWDCGGGAEGEALGLFESHQEVHRTVIVHCLLLPSVALIIIFVLL